MIKKLMSALMALTLAFSALAVQPTDAQAGHRGGRVAAGVAAGIIGLGILGAYAHGRDRHDDRYYSSERECYPGPERCSYGARRCWYNSWGDYVCRRGEYRCYREQICD
jgi:hypothetical protein